MTVRKRRSKKPQPVLPELLQKAIDETLESLTKPIPPGESGKVVLGYRRALLCNRERLESAILFRWRVLTREANPNYQKAQSEFWGAVKEGYDRCNAELVSAGFDPPGDDINKWIRLANVVETDPNFTNIGALAETALTWAEREMVRERIKQHVRAERSESIEWSRLVGQNDLRTKLEISQDTMKARLVDSLQPVSGKYRCKRATATARKVEVAIEDMPSYLHQWLRKQVISG